jgi:glycosyltransferase involved in cell wall biosynthesis
MRVLMITPTFYPIIGGAEAVVLSLSKGLNEMGLSTDVMTFNMDKRWVPKWSGKTERNSTLIVYKIPGLNYLPFTHSPRFNLGINLLPGRFADLIKRYDILHFHMAEFSFPFFSFGIRKPKILHLHGLRFAFYARYRLNRIFLKTGFDAYFALSKHQIKKLVTLGIPAEKIVHMANSVDSSVFCPGKQHHNNVILYVGRISHEKGLHILLRSLKYLKQPIHLKIVGPMQKSDLDYCRAVFDIMQREKSKGNHSVEYLGVVNKKTLIQLYQSATIFVLPSLYEPFAIVILEAMACGTPVVATSVGGVPEIVNTDENGLLVPPGNPMALAGAINYLIKNEPIRNRLGTAGRKSAEEIYDLKLQVRKLYAIYQSLYNS